MDLFVFQGSGSDSTARHLQHVMNSTRSPSYPMTGYGAPYATSSLAPSDKLFKDIDCDEVYPRLYIGNA